MRSPLSRSRALAAIAAAPLLFAGPAAAQSLTPLRIATVPTESYAEPLYALDGNFFAKAGFNVELVLFSTGGQVTNALAGNAADVGMADPTQVALAVNRGIPFGIFFGGTQYTTDAPTSLLCVAKAGPIRTATDLEGQTVGINGLRSAQEFAVREWMRTNNADPEKVRFTEVPPSAMSVAVQRGTVAAAIITEPVLSSARDDVQYFAKAYDAIAKTFYINTWFANRDWLAKNADTARKIAQVVADTARWANTHHDDTAPILAKYAKLEPDRVRKMTRAAYATGLATNLMQPILDVSFRYKLFEKRVNAADLVVKIA